jgi:hypothetical protein
VTVWTAGQCIANRRARGVTAHDDWLASIDAAARSERLWWARSVKDRREAERTGLLVRNEERARAWARSRGVL